MSDTPFGDLFVDADDPEPSDGIRSSRARAGFIRDVLACRPSAEQAVERRSMAEGFAEAARHPASPADAAVQEALDAVGRLSAGEDRATIGVPTDGRSAQRLARALDRVDRRRRQRWERRLPVSGEEDGGRSTNDAVQDWRREVGALVVDGSRSVAEQGDRSLAWVVERSLDAGEDQARALVEGAGGRWESYRTLYRAARVASARAFSWRADEHVSGVVSTGGTPSGLRPAIDLGTGGTRPVLHGRTALLRSVVTRICGAGPTVTFLLGRAGIGKSAVAARIAQSVRTSGLATFRVSAPDANALVAGLEQVAGELEVPITALHSAHREARDTEAYVGHLWHLLDGSAHDWLVVVDDVPAEAAERPGWFREPRRGNVLVLVRGAHLSTWSSDRVHVLDELAPADAEALLTERLNSATTNGRATRIVRDAVRRVCAHLPGLPLALVSVGDLLASARREDLATWVDHLAARPWDDAVDAVYSTCLDALGPARSGGRALLRLVASFAPDEPLPAHILDGIAERTLVGPVDGITALLRVGLLEHLDAPGETAGLRIHPAIAEFSRRDFGDDAAVVRIDARAVELLERESAGIDPGRPADWPAALVLEPHVHEVVESPAFARGRVSEDLGARVLDLAAGLGTALMRAGLHEHATALLDRALHRFAWLGPRHPTVLAADLTRSWMIALDRGGDIPRARARVERQVELCEQVLGPEAPTTVTARDTLGWLLGEQDELVEAKRVLMEVVRSRCAQEPPDLAKLLASRHRLAWIDVMLGDGESAVGEFWAVFVERLRLLGSDHLDVLSTRYRLAWALSRLRRHEQARAQFDDLLEQAEATLGADHQLALMVRSRVAWAAMWAGELRAAKEAYTALLPDQEKVLGADHRRVLVNTHNLAVLTMRLGDPAAAEEELRSVVARRDELLGTDHPLSMDSREMHAWALYRAGRAADAERELMALLADRRRVLGERHVATLDARFRVARVVMHRGRLAEAERRIVDLIAEQECVLGRGDPRVLRSRHALALVQGLQGRQDEAGAILRSVLAAQTMSLGAEDEETLTTRDRLVWLDGVSGRFDGLVDLAEGVLEDRRRVLGDEHPHTDTSRYRRAWALLFTGRLTEARDDYAALVDRLERLRPPRHPHTLRARLGLVQVRRLTGDLVAARAQADELVEALVATQGPFALATLRAEEERAHLRAVSGDLDGAAEAFRDVRVRQARVLSPQHFDVQRVRFLEEGALGLPPDWGTDGTPSA